MKEIKKSDEYFDFINEETAFAEGAKFTCEKQVREYFTVQNMDFMFDFFSRHFAYAEDITQNVLNDYAEHVIENKLHCDF